MKKFVALILTAALMLPISAMAMGSGDKFSDAQTGLTYSVYKPSNTLGMAALKFELQPCQPGKEEWLYLKYGGTKRYLEIMQTMSGVKCSDPGLSKYVRTVVINGSKAAVHVYCDPSKPASYKKCNISDIARVGGYLIFKTKAVKPYKGTELQVQGIGGITYAQLVTVAKALKTVKASGMELPKVVAPIMIDPMTTTQISARVGSSIVLNVADPANWSAMIMEPALATFIPGGDQGTYSTNPGITALAAGTTIVHVTHGSDMYEITLTIIAD